MTTTPAQSATAPIPAIIRFGTSSWTYPGWEGLVYHRKYKSEREFKAESLAEYAQDPLFRAVGVDSFFYAPPKPELLRRYSESVPDDFRFVTKVWERITIPVYPKHPRYGIHAGQRNPDFLNAELFYESILKPIGDSPIRPKMGPFVFQFQPMSEETLKDIHFLDRLEEFLGELPFDFRYACEIRNHSLLNSRYFHMLNKAGCTHCFNHWQRMPPLQDQMKRAAEAGGLSAPFFVARILTPLGVSYAQAVKLFEPYKEIKRPIPEMRNDVVRIAKRAIERNIDAFIIVNNRSEGCAPTTSKEIASILRSEI